MEAYPARKRRQAGFSLLELLTVLLLLAMIAAVSAPATGRFLRTIADRKKSHEIMATLRYALSGTGTGGATLRIYHELYEADQQRQNVDAQQALSSMVSLGTQLAQIETLTGRTIPSVIT